MMKKLKLWYELAKYTTHVRAFTISMANTGMYQCWAMNILAPAV